jgi:hypothetical protein
MKHYSFVRTGERTQHLEKLSEGFNEGELEVFWQPADVVV